MAEVIPILPAASIPFISLRRSLRGRYGDMRGPCQHHCYAPYPEQPGESGECHCIASVGIEQEAGQHGTPGTRDYAEGRRYAPYASQGRASEVVGPGQRGQRIPKVAAQVGSVFNIKPVLTVSSGTIHFAGAVRNRSRGIERILQMMRDKVGQKPVHVAVMHVYARDEAERLKERVSAEFNCVELWLAEFSPVMGYACGTGTVGLAFYTED